MKFSWVSFIVVSTLVLSACASGDSEVEATNTDSTEAQKVYVEELIINDLVEGEGEVAEAGKNLIVHYTLWYYDSDAEGGRGERLQSSKDSGQPFPFPLGQSRVISGWDQGVVGMKVGGTRELTVPYALAYGEGGRSGIAPKADLIFEIELLEIQ